MHSGKLDIKAYEQIFKEMKETFGFKMVTSLRESIQPQKMVGEFFYMTVNPSLSKRYEIDNH